MPEKTIRLLINGKESKIYCQEDEEVYLELSPEQRKKTVSVIGW